MLALYIILFIAALLFLLLFSSVCVRVSSEDKFTLRVSYLLLRFSLPKTKGEARQKRKKVKGEKKENSVKKMLRQKGLAGTVSEISSLLKIVLSKFGETLKHVNVKKCTFVAVAASSDPAITGIEYGAVCAAVFPLLSLLQRLMKWNFKKTNVSVKSDFNSDKPSLMIDLKLKIRLWFLVTAACAIIFKIVKNKTLQQNKSKA